MRSIFARLCLACLASVPLAAPAGTPAAAEGPLTATVRSIQEDEYREPCDEKFRDIQLKIAAALDSRAEAIAAFAADASKQPAPVAEGTPAFVSVRLGPTFVMAPSTPFQPGSESWGTTTTNAWAKIARYYAAMKGDPINENWLTLSGWVRGMLTDDVNRVKNGTLFALDESAGPAIEALRPAVEACWKDRACEKIVLSASQEAILATQSYYAEIFARVRAAQTPEGRRRGISDLGLRLREDYGQFAFVKSPHVRATAPGQYEVAIDPGPFAEAAEETRAYIESVWRAEGRQVKVVFKSRAQFPDLFRLTLQDGVGGRSFVDYEKREVVLFPGVRSRAIAHEVGHVLGFPDVYFTIWDGQACVYGVRKNKQDIMSDPNYGAVLEAHWAKLAEMYPLK